MNSNASQRQMHIPAASPEKDTATGTASAASSAQHQVFLWELRVPMFDLPLQLGAEKMA